MLRRRAARETASGSPEPPRPSFAELRDRGWVLPSAGASWTAVGTIGSPVVTRVDGRGLVDLGRWSIDWWIGAEDRWHIPSKEAAVRQNLVGLAPVVETLVRIPGGDAVQRVYGIRGAPHPGGDEYVVVEVENRSRAPFVVALAVRPFSEGAVTPLGVVSVEPVSGGQGRDVAHLVRVDGRPGMVLPRRPARAAASDGVQDVAGVVFAGAAPEELPSVECADGLAQAAFLLPVPHTIALRIVLPVGCAVGDPAVSWPPVIRDADQVASGWAVQARRGVRLEVPDPRLSDAVTASRRFLLLAHGGDRVTATGHVDEAPSVDPAAPLILRTMGRLGRPDEVRSVLRTWSEELTGSRTRVPDPVVLDTVSHYWSLSRDDTTVEELLPEVAAAVERIGRAERRSRLSDPAERRAAAEAIRSTRRMLAGLGQPEAAERLDRLAQRLTPAPGSAAPPGRSGAPSDRGAAAELSTAAEELRLADAAGLVRLTRVLDAASPTWTWPGGGGAGAAPGGHDLAAGAALLDAVLTLLADETADGLALMSVLPPAWYGRGIEVHDLPTAFGRLSYAVRWHDERPALLWDLQLHPGVDSVRLTCPGLDPGWSTVEHRGDALVAPVPRPGLAPIPSQDDSFG